MSKLVIGFHVENIYRGSEGEVVSLAEGFSKLGYKAILITCENQEEEFPISENIKKKNLSGKNKTWALRQICRKEKIDVLIAFGIDCSQRGIYANLLRRTKQISVISQDPMELNLNKKDRKKKKRAINKSAGIVFKNEVIKSKFKKKVQAKSDIICSSIEDKFYIRQHKEGSKGRIVTLGELKEDKNQGLLISAFAEIVEEFPDRELLIYGGGEKKSFLQNKIEVLGLEGRARLMGITEEPETVLEEAELFVLSSNKDDIPCALVEAMAIGVPIITTRFDGVEDILVNGEEGIITEMGDKEELAAAMRVVLRDENLKKRLGINASEKSFKFTPEKILSRWEEKVKKTIL